MGLSCIGQAVIDNFIKNPNDSRPLFLRLRFGSIKLWSAKSKWTMLVSYTPFYKTETILQLGLETALPNTTLWKTKTL